MKKGYVYILQCSVGNFYTGSTIDIDKRLLEHQDGRGANHTRKRLPVDLVFCQEYTRIEEAFKREKQIQGWGRSKKTALIEQNFEQLKVFSECLNETNYKWFRLRSTTDRTND